VGIELCAVAINEIAAPAAGGIDEPDGAVVVGDAVVSSVVVIYIAALDVDEGICLDMHQCSLIEE
jgi:hypothetical protein